MEIITGYHFTDSTLRNGEPIPPAGKWLKHEGEIIPCSCGLHMSEHPMDALAWAPGPLLHKVELRGDLQYHGSPTDKLVGRYRRIITSIDATNLLREAARSWALDVIHLWDAPDVVKQYLQTGGEAIRDAAWDATRDAARAAEKDAARAAAWEATWAATRVAAWAAAWAAARAAARAAEKDAARAATWEATWEAAWAATRVAAWEAAWEAARAATRGAAWDAARAAEKDAQRKDFLHAVEAEFVIEEASQ